MASPVMTPPRQPRSIAGPVVLILAGVVFLLNSLGMFDRFALTSIFARYWPLLLIIWGVIKLVEHEQAKRAGLPGRGIGGGGVFLVLFIIVAGLMSTQFVRLWPNIKDRIQIGDDQDIEDLFGGNTYDYSDELSKDFPAGGSLRINNERGSVTVNVGEGSAIKVAVRKKIRAQKEDEADGYNTKTKPELTVVDKTVSLNANTQGAGDKGVSTDMDITVPRNVELVITSRRGDVNIAGMAGSLSVDHKQRGEVNVSDHAGNVTIDLDGGSSRVQHVKGDVTVQGKADVVAVEDIDGAAHLNGEFGESVRLVRISKTVSFRSARTDMEFARLDGRLDLDSGDLRADSLSGPMRLTTRSKDISLDGLSGDLRLEDSNGTVEVGLHKPGNIQIENRKGDVQVTVPPNTPLTVQARSRGGEISSDFDELKIENGDSQASANGSIGSNGPKLVINSEHGTIEIRKGSVAIVPPAPPDVPGIPGKMSKPGKAFPSPKAAPVESEN